MDPFFGVEIPLVGITLLVYSVTFALKDASLLEVPRNWAMDRSKVLAGLMSCAYCTGFHSGWLVYLLAWASGRVERPSSLDCFIFALASAVLSYLLDLVALLLEKHTAQ